MGAYGALFRTGFRYQASLRFALVSGVLTNTFFGVVRSAVFLAAFASTEEIGGFDTGDALTFVWILQAQFAVVWAPWIHELPTRIRSGEWTAELSRPGNLLGRHLSFDLGRAWAVLVVRAPIPFAFASVIYDLNVPTSVLGLSLLLVSLALGAVAAACMRYLIGTIAFFSADYRGIYSLVFGPLWLLGGFVIPTEFFPGLLRPVAQFGPLSAILRSPVAVATGNGVAAAVALQVFWVAVALWVCARVTDRATRRMVVFGG